MALDPDTDFAAWLAANYEVRSGTIDCAEVAGTTPYVACRRCGRPVYYVTKHAADYHGDAITVMPVKDTRDRTAWVERFGSDIAALGGHA